MTGESPKPCGCAHAREATPPPAPRYHALEASGGERAAEPLLAVYDAGAGVRVYGCGACGGGGEGAPSSAPTSVRIERVSISADGAIAHEGDHELALEGGFARAGARATCRGCLPWIRVETDPRAFAAWLEAARALGAVTNSRAFDRIVRSYMQRQAQEVFVVLLLDVHFHVLGVAELARGTRERVTVPVADVLRLPLVAGAVAFGVAHNHPSGNLQPSEADKDDTRTLSKASAEVGVLFMDHLIIGSAGGYYSFLDAGAL